MKHLKIFYMVIALWLSFTGTATAKPVLKSNELIDQCVPLTSTLINPNFTFSKYNPNITFCKHKRNTKIKSFFKSRMKRKARQLETNSLIKLYINDLLFQKRFAHNHDYSVNVQFWIALHTYLHLYQLY